MSKIKLLVKTDKNINELKRKEIQSIDWSTFPFEEQIQFVDANVYKKLTIEGRSHINIFLNDYTKKPVEFWNVVAEYACSRMSYQLWVNSSLETKGVMINNHPAWFESYKRKYSCLIGEHTKTITDVISKYGYEFLLKSTNDGYFFLTNPKISLDEFNTPFVLYGVSSYHTLLHFIYEVMKWNRIEDEYPVLVYNYMLKSAGYNPIDDLSPSFLCHRNACNEGLKIANKWIRIITKGNKDLITWDEAVNYIRSNPELFSNNELMEHLLWWWTQSILGSQ